MSSGAADDERVIEASRRVWEALGPNVYAVQFKARPQTWRGFLEGRGWLVLGMTGLVVIATPDSSRQSSAFSALVSQHFCMNVSAWT